MASKRELLDSISLDMKLNKAFFMKVYGYELTYPGFAEDVLVRLEFLGCSRAREYYNHFVGEYEKEHDRQMKNVAEWHLKRCREEFEEKKRKAVNENRRAGRYKFAGLPQDW